MSDLVAYKIYDSTNRRYDEYMNEGGSEELITANITPQLVTRDWINQPKDQMSGPMQCFPLTLSNKFGFAVSFPDDVVVQKDRDGLTVLSGKQYFYERGPDTFGLDTNLSIVTKENVSLLAMPAPNQFVHGLQAFTAFLSTSWWTGELQIVFRVTDNGVFKIAKNTPVASIVPIDLRPFENVSLDLYTEPVGYGKGDEKLDYHRSTVYAEASHKRAHSERGISFYQKAVNHLGKKIGEHQVKKFNFTVNEIAEPYSGNNNRGTIFTGDK
jgi:hypothetical protein